MLLQKDGTVFQQRIVSHAMLRQSSRIGKQYANMLENTIRGRKLSVTEISKIATDCCSIVRVTGTLVQKAAKGKGASPSRLVDF